MKLTLRKAMEITPLKNAKLVAGAQGLDRQIRAVNIVEVPEVSHWMRGEELLFSSGFAFGGDGQQGCKLISHLNSHGISALAIKPGKYLKYIPQDMIDYAEYLGFPLLELPSEYPYSYFMDPIYSILLNNRVTFLENITFLHERLLQAIMADDLSEFCNILSDNLKKPLYYLDQKGTIILSFGTLTDHNETQEFFIHNIENLSIRSREIQKWTHQFFDGPRDYLCVPIFVHTDIHAYLVLELPNSESSETDIIGLKYAATLVALNLMKKQSLIEKEHQLRGELLNDLLEKHYDDPEVIYRRGDIIHFNLRLPYVLFSVRFISSSPGDRKGYFQDDKSIMKDFHSIATNLSNIEHFSLMQFVKSHSIIGMLSISEEKELDHYIVFLQRIITDLKKKYPTIDTVIGLGRIYSGLEKIPLSYSESQLAVRIAEQIPKFRNIIAFENLGIYRILCELKDSSTMRNFYMENMKPILDYDNDNNGELLKTLESYFENNCNLRKTADKLFMHKNTIFFRIRKIETLLGKSLSDQDNSLELQLCLKFKKIMQ